MKLIRAFSDIKPCISLLILLILPGYIYSQDDLLKILDENKEGSEVVYINNTFKGTRLINGHTIEVRDKGVLEFLITHRFGRLNSGAYNFFGLDEANIRLGLDYSISNRLTIGIGRSSFEKVYDGFIKYQLLRQSTGSKKTPFTLTLFGSASIRTLRPPDPDVNIPFERKLAYSSQILLARKFGERLSLQLMPTIIHRNYVETSIEENTLFAIGVGGRIKLSRRIAVTGEYYPRLNGTDPESIYNSLSFGIDIETGGHVFQLMFSNSRQMIEKGFIAETDGKWGNGDIHFGFNISRVFYLSSKRKKPDW
jgi:hypothetical protein